jgi:hypothetical protein
MTTVYFCTAINYLNKLNLKDLWNEDNYSPQNIRDTELVHLLSKLNELKWIGSFTGWVVVEMKSRGFQKKLQNTQKK